MTIDWWTLGLEAINVVILVWLLGHFFWTPVVGIIDKRQAAIAADFAKVEARGKELDRAAQDIASGRAGFAAERDAILAAARKEAEVERAAFLARARKDSAALEATARAQIQSGHEAEEKAWREHSVRLAVTIAGRLAARLDGPAVEAAFLNWLVQSLENLGDPGKASLAHKEAKLDVITARSLDEAGQKRVSDAISATLGSSPAISFKMDPALIAGIELHGSHFILRNSWRADLDRIVEDLSDGD